MNGLVFGVQIAAAIFCCVSLLALVLSVIGGLLQYRLNKRRPRRADQPGVSVIIPIKDYEPSFIEAQTSAFTQLYPTFDVTLTAAETDSAACAAARKIMAAYPGIESRLVHSTACFAASPKVNNLYQAIMDAPHDIIFMKDSNIIAPAHGIESAVACMVENVGLVVAAPEARGAVGFASEIEASIMNQSHGRLLLTADALGLGFGVGKLMVFRRSDLLRAGGFEAIAHSVGEDSVMAHALESLGLRTVFMGPPIVQKLGRRSLRDVFERQLRWTVIRRHNEILAFFLEPFGLASTAALAGAIAAPLFGVSSLAGAGLVLGLWFVLETILGLARGWDGSVRSPVVMAMRDVLMLSVWTRAWFAKRVVWASNVYDAQRAGKQPTSVGGAADDNAITPIKRIKS